MLCRKTRKGRSVIALMLAAGVLALCLAGCGSSADDAEEEDIVSEAQTDSPDSDIPAGEDADDAAGAGDVDDAIVPTGEDGASGESSASSDLGGSLDAGGSFERTGGKGARGAQGGNMGGMSSHTGVGTTELAAGWEAFTYTYSNASGAEAELEYAVYVPAAYDGSEALPLVTYVGDATYVGAGVAAFAAGECPSNWISDANMEEYPCFFLVIGFTESATDITTEGSQVSQTVNIIDAVAAEYGIDTNRLYLTGQSMGGILDFALNAAYPRKFAATVYVGCQPGENVGDATYNDSIANTQFADQTFAYVASALDPKAPSGQAAIMQTLDDAGVAYGLLTDMDYQDMEHVNEDAAAVLAEGYAQNFFQFTTVTDGGASVNEHMESFEYAYEINAIYEWLMQQSLA